MSKYWITDVRLECFIAAKNVVDFYQDFLWFDVLRRLLPKEIYFKTMSASFTVSTTTSPKVELPIGPPVPPVHVGPAPKTPISELVELGIRMGLDVNFETISETGLSHERTFLMNCTAGDVSGSGSGKAKKKAKHQAAAVVIEKLKGSSTFKDHLFKKTSQAALAPHNNSVGRLQEVVTKRGWQNPEYESLSATGPPHLREFETQVVVGTLTATGKGRTKKDSKRSAAGAMIDNLSKCNLSLQPPVKKIAFTTVGPIHEQPPIPFTSGGTL